MRRGTTPKITLHLKNKDGSAFDTSLITDGRVTFRQLGVTVLEKTVSSCALENGCVQVDLTQEETLRFDHLKEVRVQAKLKLTGEKVVATNCTKLECLEIFNDEVL